MKYEEMTGKINLEELEVKANEITEISGGKITSRDYSTCCTVHQRF